MKLLKNPRILSYLGTGLCRALQLQITLTLFSLPVLRAHGIPCSLLSIVGTLLFAPFFACFLALSTLIFFSELLGLPTAGTVVVLDLVYRTWCTVLSWTPTEEVIMLTQSSPYLLGAIAVLAGLLLHHKRLRRAPFGCVTLLALMLGGYILGSASWGHFSWSERALSPDLPLLWCFHEKNRTICIDRGTLLRSPKKLLRATKQVARELIKRTGSATIDLLILLKPTATSGALAAALLASSPQATIVVPACSSYVPQAVARSLALLAEQKRTLVMLTGDTVVYSFGTLKRSGTLQRTRKFAHDYWLLDPTLPGQSDRSGKDLSVRPVVGRRERVLHQPPQEQEVNR